MVPSLLLSSPLPTLLHLMWFQLTPLFQNLQSYKLASTIWRRKRAHRRLSSMSFFRTTSECIRIFRTLPEQPYNLLSLRLLSQHLPLPPISYPQTIPKDQGSTSLPFVKFILLPIQSNSAYTKTRSREAMRLLICQLPTYKLWGSSSGR